MDASTLTNFTRAAIRLAWRVSPLIGTLAGLMTIAQAMTPALRSCLHL